METPPPSLSPDDYFAILRQDFGSFIVRSFHELNSGEQLGWNWHLDVLASKLADAAQGKIKRLIITLPPRQLKSISVSVALPAWILGHNPGAKILCASYGQDLADDLARKALAIMSSSWYERAFSTRLASNRRAVSDFHTTKRGYRRSASVGGALTGFGADFIIIDDPQKPGEALSDIQRRAANSWFDETLLSRLNNKAQGCIIIVMQRLHEDDLVGHVIARGEKWDVVNFPAIAEHDEHHTWTNAFGTGSHLRREKEVLHPEREPLHVLEGIRRQMGNYLFAAQYQQNPVGRENARIKIDWFPRFDLANPPTFDRIIQSWDTASDIKSENDYSVCTTWGVKGSAVYLLHVHREKLYYNDLEKAVMRLCAAWNADRVIVENHSSGKALIQNLPVQHHFYKVEAFLPKGDKAMRMETHTGMIEGGRVFIPKEAPWLDEYFYELQTFPNGKFDDQVDSTSQALEWINTQGREPGILALYRQDHEKREAAQRQMEGVAILRPPPGVHGGTVQFGGHNFNADKEGNYAIPLKLINENYPLGMLQRGWTFAGDAPPPPPRPPNPWPDRFGYWR